MSHIPPDDSLSTIEAPEPGWVLDGNMQIADDNQDAIELYNQVGNPRAILNKKELKQYKNQLNKIDAYLKKHQLVDLITQYDVLKSDYQGLVAQRYELIKEREYGEREDKYILSDLAILKQNARSIRKDYKQLEARLMPHRKMIILQRTIQARIDEHVQALKDEEINRRNRLLLNKEANAIGSIIIKIMNGLDFCFRTTHKGKERIVSIKFGRVIVTPETIQYQVLLSESGLFGGSIIHVPRGVDLVSAMNKSSVLQQASAATRMVVTCPQSESGRWHEGIWIFVHRNNFMDGLKEKVWFRDYIKRYPEDDKDLIPLPAGLKEGMWASWTNLAQQPHIIITGQNGSGKSNAMLTWITTLITKHSPDEIRLVLVDLKEGVDFHGFKGIPHLLGDVIEDAAAASEILVALERLRASRMNELKLAGE